MIKYSVCGALSEEMIDTILADSFPASDPPPWTGGRENQPCSGLVDDSENKETPVSSARPTRALWNKYCSDSHNL
jgi:hypothetical protein